MWMHAVPAFSAFTAVTELAVTGAVFYVFHRAIEDEVFEGSILAGAIGYEIVFNISYMVSQLFRHEHTGSHPDWVVATLAAHGTLSLAMFVGLLVFSVAAWRRHRAGGNLFRERQTWTAGFAGLWTVSLLSGEAIFVFEYLLHL